MEREMTTTTRLIQDTDQVVQDFLSAWAALDASRASYGEDPTKVTYVATTRRKYIALDTEMPEGTARGYLLDRQAGILYRTSRHNEPGDHVGSIDVYVRVLRKAAERNMKAKVERESEIAARLNTTPAIPPKAPRPAKGFTNLIYDQLVSASVSAQSMNGGRLNGEHVIVSILADQLGERREQLRLIMGDGARYTIVVTRDD
jgi:hypothetical protein